MVKRISLSLLLLIALLVVVMQLLSGNATIGISVSRGNGSNCIDCTGEPSIKNEQTTSQPANGPDRGMWVWQDDVVTDSNARQNILLFAQLKGIDGLYLHAYHHLPDNDGSLQAFIAEADASGIEVELLAGDPTWALTANHATALGFVQQAITFTQSISDTTKPTSIHLDIEPYLLSEWTNDQASTITQYLDLLRAVEQELAASGTGLTLTADIPFWFDTITATYESTTQPLNQHVQDITDRIVIMDYRDFAEGPDGIIEHAQAEMTYGESIGKGVIIGIETNEVMPEKITFFEEGETVLEEELALVEQHYQGNSAFPGFAIHDYLGYRALAPLQTIRLPVILID